MCSQPKGETWPDFVAKSTTFGIGSQLAALLFELFEIAVTLFSAPSSIRVKADA
jgi:hypothetical protein